MTLAAGSRLGSYEIVAPIGAGGMGEVFARGIRSSIATSRSKCFPWRSRRITSGWRGSSARLRFSRR